MKFYLKYPTSRLLKCILPPMGGIDSSHGLIRQLAMRMQSYADDVIGVDRDA
jgi:hypothetical protein